MRRGIVVLIAVLVCLPACQDSHVPEPVIEIDKSIAVHYKNYNWGITMEEAKQRVKDNGFEIQGILDDRQRLKDYIGSEYIFGEDDRLQLLYTDKFMGDDMPVSLAFTPITEKLLEVNIETGKINSRALRVVLIEKYGNPSYSDGSSYNKWMQNGETVLDLSDKLSYTSPRYHEVYLNERDRLMKEMQELEMEKGQF